MSRYYSARHDEHFYPDRPSAPEPVVEVNPDEQKWSDANGYGCYIGDVEVYHGSTTGAASPDPSTAHVCDVETENGVPIDEQPGDVYDRILDIMHEQVWE